MSHPDQSGYWFELARPCRAGPKTRARRGQRRAAERSAAALMRSLKGYSAENDDVHIEGAARTTDLGGSSAHPTQMTRLVSDQIRISSDTLQG
jgi:hypothetical protein